MKKINLIEWLWKTDSHEKQTPQSFVRMRARTLLTLLCLLTLGIGQMWATDYYLRGDMNSWNNLTADYKFTNTSGSTYTLTVEISSGSQNFKISDSSWNNDNTYGKDNNNGAITIGNAYICKKPGDDNLNINFPSTANYTFTLNTSTNSLTVTQVVSPSVSLDASSTSVECGASVTFTATGNNLGGESATYKFEDITGGGSSVIQEASSTYTCTTSWATAGTKTVKVTMKVGDDEYTDTYDVTIVSYIYFYAAVPYGWTNNNTKVSIGSSSSTDTLTAYNNTSLAYSNAKSVYEAVSSTALYNSGNTYNIKIYRVPSSDAGQNVYVGNNGWCFGTAAIGQVASGKLYTLTSGDNGGTYMAANAISVNSVSASGPYAIDAVTLTSYISAYGTSTSNLRTAGGDTFTTTYTLNDQTASTSTVITPEVSNTYTSNTGNLAGSITIDPSDLTAGHTYTLTVTIADDITGKMTSSATSSSFAISNPSYKVYYGVHESGHGTLAATYTSGGASIGSSGSSVAYGSGLTFTATPSQTYYEVEGFYSDEDCTSSLQSGNSTTYTIASLSGETNVYVKFKLKDFTVTYNNMTGATNDAGNPSSVTYETTAVTLGDPEKTGYTFDGWYDNSSFTGSKVTTIPTHTTADVGLWAKWTEKTYTVTLTNATSASVTAGIATNPSITAAVAPFGMAFARWEVSGGASVASTTSSTTTVSATAAGIVTAVYVQNMWVYIQGRFEAYTDKTKQTLVRTGTNSGSKYWDTSSSALKMDYDSENHVYYLHTYKSPSELKQYDNDAKFYISLKTSSSSSGLSDVTEYFSDSETTIDAKDNKIGFATTPGSTRPYINNTTTDKYLVLYWDGEYMWYEEEDIPAVINNVALSVSRVPPLAPITATPNMYDIAGVGEKAYCWGVYTDLACTNQVTSVSFTSLGDGKVQFAAPQAERTYYLKLTVRASAACDAAIDDEKVVSFTVSTSQMVFFKNVPNWGNVHFYFLGDSYWDSEPDPDKNKGSGCAGRDGGSAHGMTRIGNSNVYYYDYSGNSVMTTYLSSHSSCYIAFTDNYKPGSNNFAGCQAAYRGDFSACAPMYVPENWITNYCNKGSSDGQAVYYNRGYWTNYMSTRSGFALCLWDKTANNADGEIRIDSVELVSDKAGSNTYVYTYNFGVEDNHRAHLPYTYGFKLVGCGGSYYGADDDMTVDKCTDWNLYTGTRKCGLNVLAALPHSLIITLSGDGKIRVDAEYPLNEGDYRLLYDDNTQNPHPSQFIRKRANGKDTVAMFIRPSETENLKVQYCSKIEGEAITWTDYQWKTGVDTIYVAGKADGVYNFYLEQDADKNLTVNTSATEPYSGKYYIRTSVVDGGWNSYKSTSDNLMTYAQYPDDMGYGFNYYKAKWVEATGSDVTYTIACDYSPSLSDTLVGDPGDTPLDDEDAISLPHSANIRFGWHSGTNQLKREYINGSTNISDRFLVMMGDSKIKDSEGRALNISGLNPNEISFTDLNNWIYRCDIQAQTGAAVKLQATYDGHEQYFIGDEDETEEIIGGSSGEWYGMRVTYDFKTNRLMTAWLPDGNEVESNVVLNADMMLIRKGQNAATQVYFGTVNKDKSISNIHRIYGVLEFQYDSIVGKFSSWSSPNAYKYLMYYISFPFDVKVSEIFGCGVRGTNWIIQKYNGAKRAQIGWFAETSTFWETLPGDSTLHANEGYLLILDRISFNDARSSLWYKQGSGNSIYLYFPSESRTVGTIKDNNEEVIIKIPSHTCEIERPFTPDIDGWSGGELVHSNTDSHWNVFGTPLFQSKAATTVGDSKLKYFYSWNYADNTLRPRVTLAGDTVFKSMHGYMVQFAGDVTFTGAHISASVVARRMPSNKHYLAELQLVNENGDENATYVELRENANTDFQLNEDMYMMRSSNTVDLYSFAGAYDVAANVLPIDDQLVRVGVDVKRAGTYRITMPSEFSGTVILIDNLMGTRTNMAFGDHEVYLERGVDNNRFLLEIDIQQMPTAIDGVGGSLKDGKAHKFIQNGQMYILQNGVIYDAQGRKMK